MNDLFDIDTDKNEMTQEQCYLLAVKTVQDALIVWPENSDSKLWNQRVTSLLGNLCLAFGYDGENE